MRLRVADLERSLRFYRDVLGLVVDHREGSTAWLRAGDQPDDDSRSGGGQGPAQLIVLEESTGVAPRPSRPRTAGLYHVALLLPSRRALGHTLQHLGEVRYPMRGTADHAVSESLYLDDPDGIGLELYADRPRERWPVEGGLVQMTVDPLDLEGVMAAGRERPAPWAGLARETVIGHVHFTVSWLERSVAFYRDVVGFEVTFRVPTLVGVAAAGYHHHVNLNVWAGEGAPPDSETVAGLIEWELRVPAATARNALVRRLEAAGALESNGLRPVARDPDRIALAIVPGPNPS